MFKFLNYFVNAFSLLTFVNSQACTASDRCYNHEAAYLSDLKGTLIWDELTYDMPECVTTPQDTYLTGHYGNPGVGMLEQRPAVFPCQ